MKKSPSKSPLKTPEIESPDQARGGSSGGWLQNLLGNSAIQSTLSGLSAPRQEPEPRKFAVPPSTPMGESIAEWALNADKTNDQRFENETTTGAWDWLKHGHFFSGYAKCNMLVSAAFKEGGGFADFPTVDGRAPVVSELANPANFTDTLSYSTDPSAASLGSMVLWHHDVPNSEHDVGHSAIITGYDEKTGEPLVSYAGTGEEGDDNTTTRPLSEVTEAFRADLEGQGVDPSVLIPIYRSAILPDETKVAPDSPEAATQP